MNDTLWTKGFAIASRLYHIYGHLDFDEDAVTSGGYPIGEFLQYNREHCYELNTFDMLNLTAMGMIWSRKNLGYHKDFKHRYEILKLYFKKHKDIETVNDIKEPDIREIVLRFMRDRELHLNEVLTLRQVDMLRSIGVPFVDKNRRAEELAYAKNVQTFIDLARGEIFNINKDNRKGGITVEKYWYTGLLDKYMSNTEDQVTSEDIACYIRKIVKWKATEIKDKQMIELLNGNKPGLASWIVSKLESDTSKSEKSAAYRLSEWLEIMKKFNWSIDDIDISEQYTLQGTKVTDELSLVRDKSLLPAELQKYMMAAKEPEKKKRTLEQNANVMGGNIKRQRNQTEAKNKANAEVKKEVEEIANGKIADDLLVPKNLRRIRDKKETAEVKEKKTRVKREKAAEKVIINKDWVDNLLKAVKKDEYFISHGFVPNNVEEAQSESLKELIKIAYDNKDKLLSKYYLSDLAATGFLFLETDKEPLYGLREGYQFILDYIKTNEFIELVYTKSLKKYVVHNVANINKILYDSIPAYRNFRDLLEEAGNRDLQQFYNVERNRMNECILIVLKSKIRDVRRA